MRLIDYLDKGAALGPRAPCLTVGERDISYVDVQRITWRVASGLQRAGVKPGDKVAILSSNDPVAFACVFASAPSGVRSTHAMRRPRTASSSTLSTARA
jgi:fatty-acyl-CoA synthase